MRSSFRLFVVRGIELGAHWSLLVVIWLIGWGLAGTALPEGAPGYTDAEYWVAGIATAVAFLAGIAAHELGHAVIAQRRGIGVKRITLWLFGGVAELQKQPATWRDELSVAIAGPMVSIVMGGAALGSAAVLSAAADTPLVVSGLVWLGSTNLLLAGFNLLPGAPLDGGRVFTALRWRHHGDAARARSEGARAGLVLANTMIGLGIVSVFVGLVSTGLWFAFLGWFLSSAARAELGDELTRHALEGVRIAQVMTAHPETVAPDMSLETLVTDVLSRVRGSTIPVVYEGRLAGLITPDHLRRVPPREWWSTLVGDVATPAAEVRTAAPDDEVLTAFEGTDSRRLVVVEHGEIVGIVTPTDLARVLRAAQLRELASHR